MGSAPLLLHWAAGEHGRGAAHAAGGRAHTHRGTAGLLAGTYAGGGYFGRGGSSGGRHALHDEGKFGQGQFPLGAGLDLVEVEAEKGLLGCGEGGEVDLGGGGGRAGG